MKNFLYFFLIFIFVNTTILAQSNISDLLGDFAQQSDLSNKTKKESAGFLIVYTRQDLDSMKIHSLKEIIEKIPFLRYNEDNAGLTSPFYYPYQPSPANAIRVYINDRELVTPFNGNALKLFGQMSIGFIDHIEIYMGIPSQSLGIQPAWITIKCYTKDPQREETNVVGTGVGSYGTKEIYGYSAKSLKNFSYLVYLNNRNLKRAKNHYHNTDLLKNKNITNFYGQIQKNGLRGEVQISKGKMDNFMGSSYNIDPSSVYTDFDYFYAGIYYKNKNIKAFINFSQDRTDHYDNSKTILGAKPLPFYPFVYTYKKSHIKLKEQISDAQVYRIFKVNKNKLTLGIQNRYEHFKIEQFKLGDISINNSAHFNKEFIFSVFAENNYMLNAYSMITAAVKLDKNVENGDVKDYKTYSGRLGYIYNNSNWTGKIFFFIGDTKPSMKILFENRVLYHQSTDTKKEKKTAFAAKLIYKIKNNISSLLFGHTISNNQIYFSGTGYDNLSGNYMTDTLSFRNTYSFNALNRIIFNIWIDATHKQGNSISNAPIYSGGSLSFFNSIRKFDFYNNIIYKHWSGVKNDGWNLNSTVTYRYSRDLTIFVKAENILKKALKSNYYVVNPLNGKTSYLEDVDSVDRRLWIGLEYQF